MLTKFSTHRFNDDLLLSRNDREYIYRKYPSIAHVLDFPELRSAFEEYDRPANQAKRTSRKLGCTAIALIFVALLFASFEHFLPHSHGQLTFIERMRDLPGILALLASLCGICGVLIGGMGVLHSSKKHNWLMNRLATERIRQFHFQTIVCRNREVIASLCNDEARESFLESKRLVWFEELNARLGRSLDSEYEAILELPSEGVLWQHPSPEPRLSADDENLESIFEAYRELRFQHQLQYANHKLSTAGWSSLRNQKKLLQNAASIAVVILFFVDVLAIGMILVGFHPDWGALFASISISIALFALAAKALEEGLQPSREIERYQQYRTSIQAILDRFESAKSAGEKLDAMAGMERLAFDEMRDFLMTHEEARFVM